MSSPKKCLSVAIDRERKVAHITIAYDDGARFEGDYCEEDARGLTGAIVNSANFLDIIEDLAALDNPGCTLEASPYSSKTIIKLHAVATVGRVSLADDIEIICPRVAAGDAHVAIEKYRAELAERDARIMTLERDLARVAALAEFTIRWGNLPVEGAELWRELVNRELSGDPVVFPVIGREFIMLGDKMIKGCPRGLKTRCIYCQTLYVRAGYEHVNNIGIEMTTSRRWEFDDIKTNRPFPHLQRVVVEIGHVDNASWTGTLRARITKDWTCKEHQSDKDGKEIRAKNRLYVESQLFLGMSVVDDCYIDWLSDAVPTPIMPEFVEAQHATAHLLALAPI